jgi:hypothetical protein
MDIPYDDNLIHFDGVRGTFLHGYMIDVRDSEILDMDSDKALVDVGTQAEAASLIDFFKEVYMLSGVPAPCYGPRVILRCYIGDLPDDIVGDAFLEFTGFTVEDGKFCPILTLIGMKGETADALLLMF